MAEPTTDQAVQTELRRWRRAYFALRADIDRELDYVTDTLAERYYAAPDGSPAKQAVVEISSLLVSLRRVIA